jgi:LCP family protein required for cell wall assembly
MPELNSPKKRVQHDSIDGMIPSRRPNINAHQYYKSGTARSTGPRRPLSKQPNHRAQLHADDGEITPENEKTVPLIGDFSAKEQNIFDGGYVPEPKKKQKKEKKGPGRLRRWWKNRSRKFKVLFIAFLICLGLAGLLGARLYSFLNSVFSNSVGNSSSAALEETDDPTKLNTEGDGRLNILMLGRGGTENEAPDLTDTMLIASIDLQNQSVSLLSVPRDTWVRVNGEGMKINAAYSTGKQYSTYKGKSKDAAEDEGIKTAINAVRGVAGVPIHKYVLTDYKAFRDVVNALGGVDIDVNDGPIYDRFTGWRFKDGLQTMNGVNSTTICTYRHGSARGDFDRNENQRQLLVAMRKKATSTGIVANPVRLNSLANAVQKNIRTDLSLDEAKTLFEKTKTLPDSSIKSLDLAKPDDPLITTGEYWWPVSRSANCRCRRLYQDSSLCSVQYDRSILA